jgi:hypothetical protein
MLLSFKKVGVAVGAVAEQAAAPFVGRPAAQACLLESRRRVAHVELPNVGAGRGDLVDLIEDFVVGSRFLQLTRRLGP